MECVLQRIAEELNRPLIDIQEANFIADGHITIKGHTIKDCTLPVVWGALKTKARYDERFAAAQAFNAANLWRKRGVACSPVK